MDITARILRGVVPKYAEMTNLYGITAMPAALPLPLGAI
jgi:hypothetical protein